MPYTFTLARFLVIASCLSAGAASAAPQASRGLRFDSAGVIDVSARDLAVPGGRDVPVVALDAQDAERIASAPALDEAIATLSSADDVFACKPASRTCSTAGERKSIAAAGGAVKREKDKLSIVPTAGTTAVFIDWKLATTKNADGDGERHWYVGAMKGNGYHRVEVEFEHDAPGDFLINPASGKTMFVHYASDVTALAPDGSHLLTYDALNEPLSIRIVALDAKGPSVAVMCTGKADGTTHTEFKGWRDATTAELAIVAHGARNRLAHATPIRFARTASGFQLASGDAAALAALSFSCRQFP